MFIILTDTTIVIRVQRMVGVFSAAVSWERTTERDPILIYTVPMPLETLWVYNLPLYPLEPNAYVNPEMHGNSTAKRPVWLTMQSISINGKYPLLAIIL